MRESEAFRHARNGFKVRDKSWKYNKYITVAKTKDWRNGEWINESGKVIQVFINDLPNIGIINEWEIYNDKVAERRRLSKLELNELIMECS